MSSIPPMSACQQLKSMLLVEPRKTKEQNESRDPIKLIMGTSGFNFMVISGLETETYNDDTNQILRAMAACQLGLHVSNSLPRTYYDPTAK